MAKARRGKYVWVSWLPKLMTGETNCQWASWYRTRYELKEKAARDFDQVSWKVEHTRMRQELAQRLEAEGKKVFLEEENRFSFSFANLTLAGKPDLIALSKEKKWEIYDCKTGQPRDSDQVQMAIYMYCLPKASPEFKERIVKGYIVYRNQEVEIPAEKIDQRFEEDFRYFLNLLADDREPEKRPSPSECRFCDIPKSICPERREEGEDEELLEIEP